jgi:hypothetical protein
LKNERLREKQVRAIRAEIDRLRQIYEATWVERQMFSARAAETIRGEIERSVEPVTQQLELPLGEHRNSDVEGEKRCKK